MFLSLSHSLSLTPSLSLFLYISLSITYTLTQAIHHSATAPDGAFSRLDCGAIGIDGFASPFAAEVSALAGRPVSAERLVDQLKAATESSHPQPFEEMIETIVELKVSPSGS